MSRTTTSNSDGDTLRACRGYLTNGGEFLIGIKPGTAPRKSASAIWFALKPGQVESWILQHSLVFPRRSIRNVHDHLEAPEALSQTESGRIRRGEPGATPRNSNRHANKR